MPTPTLIRLSRLNRSLRGAATAVLFGAPALCARHDYRARRSMRARSLPRDHEAIAREEAAMLALRQRDAPSLQPVKRALRGTR